MRTKNKIFTAATLTFAAGSIVAGSLITSDAMASTAAPPTATITAIVPDAAGTGWVSCTLTDVPLAGAIPVPAGPGEPFTLSVSAVGSDGEPTAIGGTTGPGSEHGTSANGPTSVSAADGPGLSTSGSPDVAATPVGGALVVSSINSDGSSAPGPITANGQRPDGSIPSLNIPTDVKAGTGAECAGFTTGVKVP